MKNIIILFSLSLFILLACSLARQKKIISDCHFEKDNFFNEIVRILIDNNYKITLSDKAAGLLVAETLPKSKFLLDGSYYYRFSFQLLDSALTVQAQQITNYENIFGNPDTKEKAMSDDSPGISEVLQYIKSRCSKVVIYDN